MSAPNPSLLDSGQTLQGSYDEDSGSLRVKTDANESSVEIFQLDPEGLNTNSHLLVNGQPVSDTNPVPTTATLSISTEISVVQDNPEDLQTTANLSVDGQPVSNTNPIPTTLALGTEVSVIQDNPLELQTNAHLIVNSSPVSELNPVPVLLDQDSKDTLTTIDDKLPNLGPQIADNSLSVTLASDHPDLNTLLFGTDDGLETGNKFLFVNNIKNQILATDDRDQEIIYQDFGTKNQRITEINYTSSRFPGIVAKKTLTYVLDSGKYKRTNITWSIE